tara:strand:- start:1 stop:882 length:882 start_codon:yes stop_codon:yes gene_type:complete
MAFIFANDEIGNLANDKKNTPQLDLLRDGVKLNFNIYDNMLRTPDSKLIKEQINEIKENAKNYIVTPVTTSDIVVMETSHGALKLKLFPEKAPNHCNNFKRLANSGFYDKTVFHRIIPGFMIQGGDILSRDQNPDNDGTGNPGWTIDQEFNDIRHKRGILSMARSQDVNSAGSQFFICVDEAYHLDLKYTAFGEVIENDNVLDIITKLPSQAKQILRNSKLSIPDDGTSKESWLSYRYGGKEWYIKIPKTKTKSQMEVYVKSNLKNKHKTHVPVFIKKVRVVDINTIDDNKND